MTITVSVKVRDGIVLGTDSMTQILVPDEEGNVGVAKTYSHARKLFQIATMPIGVMAYGAGNIAERTPESLVLEYSRRMEQFGINTRSVEAVARGLCRFIQCVYYKEFGATRPEDRPVMGFFVGGYSIGSPFAEEWEFQLPRDGDVLQVRPPAQFGGAWRGRTAPINRLYWGFDPDIRNRLAGGGVPFKYVQAIFSKQLWSMPIAFPAMPIQDAVNFTTFVLRITIGYYSFVLGPPDCGGPIQLATVLPDKGFEWVSEPKLSMSQEY